MISFENFLDRLDAVPTFVRIAGADPISAIDSVRRIKIVRDSHARFQQPWTSERNGGIDRPELGHGCPVFANRDALTLRNGSQEFGGNGLGFMDIHGLCRGFPYSHPLTS